jgi:hypothetical protein
MLLVCFIRYDAEFSFGTTAFQALLSGFSHGSGYPSIIEKVRKNLMNRKNERVDY